LNQVATNEAVSWKLEIGEVTFHRACQLYGDEGPEIARLREMERENAWLKKIVAQPVGDIDTIKDLNRKNW
jgi:putative transposase